MKTITTTDARKNLFSLTKETIMSNDIVRITSREGSCILISEEEYESILETAYLLQDPALLPSLKEGKNNIKNNELHSFDDIFTS